MIDARIEAIINFVQRGSRVADIGADHGYLSIEIARRNLSSFVIATDKNSGPISAAKKNIADVGLENVVEVRQGDGLNVLRVGEVDTICIAGMGGALICEILNNSPEVLHSTEQLILQPMNAVDKVIAWLESNSWFVADVDLAESGGIIYEIINAVKDSNAVSRPTKKDTSPLLKKFLSQKIQKLQRVLDEMSKSPVAVQSEKFLQIQSQISNLEVDAANLIHT